MQGNQVERKSLTEPAAVPSPAPAWTSATPSSLDHDRQINFCGLSNIEQRAGGRKIIVAAGPTGQLAITLKTENGHE